LNNKKHQLEQDKQLKMWLKKLQRALKEQELKQEFP
jgi:hypothetical protein